MSVSAPLALSTRTRSLITLSTRFKTKTPKPPRDPPPTNPLVKRTGQRTFDPFVSPSEFASDPNRGGRWTQIDHSLNSNAAQSSINDDNQLITQSPDAYSRSVPMVLPRTPGLKQIAKWAAEEPMKHQLPPRSKIEIVAQDDNYIFVHKPAGIACHGTEEYVYSKTVDMMDIESRPTRKRKRSGRGAQQTFYEQFMDYWWSTYPFFRFQPRLLHRLDKDVSGIMVFGKKWCAEEHFTKLIQGNSDYIYGCGVKKCYIAVCKGIPNKSEGLIEGMIKKAHWNYRRFAIYPHKGQKFVSKEARVDMVESEDHKYVDNRGGGKHGGSHVKTEFKVVDTCNHGKIGVCSLIIFTIHTGKRHQIRASAAALGCPIVGDVVYGGSKYNTLLLHSLFVGFEGIVDTDLIYAVSCLPKWSHLSNHFWSTKAQYYTQQHLDFLMTVPRPSKKPRVIQFSMRKERAKLKRELLKGKNQFLLPMDQEQDIRMLEDGNDTKLLSESDGLMEMERGMREKGKKEMEIKYSKSGLQKMEEYVADNFIKQTVSSHIKQLEKSRRLRVFEKSSESSKNSMSYDTLIDGAVPSHFVDVV